MKRTYSQFDIVLVDYPFSDEPSQGKIRPALIISNEKSNADDMDYLFCPITSTQRSGYFSIELTNNDVVNPMQVVCEVRCNKVMTIREMRIRRKISALKFNKQKEVIERILKAIEIS